MDSENGSGGSMDARTAKNVNWLLTDVLLYGAGRIVRLAPDKDTEGNAVGDPSYFVAARIEGRNRVFASLDDVRDFLSEGGAE